MLLQNVLVFLTAGDDVGPGQFLLNGHEDVVATLGPQYVLSCTIQGGTKMGTLASYVIKYNYSKN